MLAAFRSFFAAVIDCWSSVFAALARTSPGVTASPTLALTSATCQMPVGVDDSRRAAEGQGPAGGGGDRAGRGDVVRDVGDTGRCREIRRRGGGVAGEDTRPDDQSGSADDQEHDDRDDLELHEERLPSGMAPRGRGATP